MMPYILMYWFKTKNTDSTERRKTNFPKEIVENADLHKSIVNKIMTTQEKWVDYDFIAPVRSFNEIFRNNIT